MSDYPTVEELVARSRAAFKKFEFATQEQADAAARATCKVVYDNAEELGPMAAEESRMGDPNDKIQKCRAKSSLIWASIKDKKTVGIIDRDEEKKMLYLGKPMGVVACISPSTNPIVTPMCNAADALKTRNSIIFAPHPRGVKCTLKVTELFRNELKKLGLPEDLVLTLEHVSMEDSGKLMKEADVIVATGGPGMVKAAYSSGKPSLGVGQGDVQCIVDRDVDLNDAAAKIVAGRSFDNGLICLGEQTAFIPEEKFDDFVKAFNANGGYFVTDPEDTEKVRRGVFPEKGGPISRDITGRNAMEIAEMVGITVPEGTKAIGVKPDALGAGDDLCREKLCPVISLYPYKTWEEGVAGMVENLENEGKGHSISVHSHNEEHIEYAAVECSVSRVVVNQPSGTVGGGSPTNGFTPTTTLGCGSWGGNSFSGNFNYKLLMNITRVGFPYEEPWLKDPEDAWK
ncbi:MAG: aldehyde dehydrogenase family protein [Anaerovoracaceae bacterium]